MFAVIETGGKQYKVQAGDTIFVEKLAVEADATVDFKVILLTTMATSRSAHRMWRAHPCPVRS